VDDTDDPNCVLVAPIQAGVALDLAQASEPTQHGRNLRRRSDVQLPDARLLTRPVPLPLAEGRRGYGSGVSVKPKRKTYAIALAPDGALTAEDRARLELEEEWTPEHLVLAALALCSVKSLAYHARRASLGLAASAAASGVVAPREGDGTWAFVEIECEIDTQLDPTPPVDDVRELTRKAERGCFVASSLTAKPLYRWTVNGERVE
jgi:organic hydroperoxide reductase OsmC/OhrA